MLKENFCQLDLGDKYSFLHGPDMTERSTRCNTSIFLLFLRINFELVWRYLYKVTDFKIHYDVFGLDADTSNVCPTADNGDVSTETKPKQSNNLLKTTIKKIKSQDRFWLQRNFEKTKIVDIHNHRYCWS